MTTASLCRGWIRFNLGRIIFKTMKRRTNQASLFMWQGLLILLPLLVLSGFGVYSLRLDRRGFVTALLENGADVEMIERSSGLTASRLANQIAASGPMFIDSVTGFPTRGAIESIQDALNAHTEGR